MTADVVPNLQSGRQVFAQWLKDNRGVELRDVQAASTCRYYKTLSDGLEKIRNIDLKQTIKNLKRAHSDLSGPLCYYQRGHCETF